MAQSQFVTARLKIQRANRHIKEIITGIEEESSSADSYRLSVEPDPETGGEVLCFEVVKLLSPAFSLITGDAVHCLRSALDHMMSEIFALRTKKDPSRIHFPMHETRENLIDTL